MVHFLSESGFSHTVKQELEKKKIKTFLFPFLHPIYVL